MSAHRPIVSQIIPVYNAERFLPACLDSLLAQRLADIEILVVDNGSTDRSVEIATEYSRRDSRIRVMSAPGGYQGRARNAALDVAQGGFISFIDADDWVDPDLLTALHEESLRTGAQVVRAGYTMCRSGNEGPFRDEKVLPPRMLWPWRHAIETIGGRERLLKLRPALWSSLYRRDWWMREAIRFPENLAGEDQVVKWKTLAAAPRIALVYRALYNYRVVAGSSSLIEDTRLLPIIDNFSEIADFLRQRGDFAAYFPTFFTDRAACLRHTYQQLAPGVRPAFRERAASALHAELAFLVWATAVDREAYTSWVLNELPPTEHSWQRIAEMIRALVAANRQSRALPDRVAERALWMQYVADLSAAARLPGLHSFQHLAALPWSARARQDPVALAKLWVKSCVLPRQT